MTDDRESLETAYLKVGEALKALGVRSDYYAELHEVYFDLKAALLARNDHFQEIDLGGTDIHTPSDHTPRDNPTVRDEAGEWEFPTGKGQLTILDGIKVAKPDNPHHTPAVHIDHLVYDDGTVEVQVNATPLNDLLTETHEKRTPTAD